MVIGALFIFAIIFFRPASEKITSLTVENSDKRKVSSARSNHLISKNQQKLSHAEDFAGLPSEPLAITKPTAELRVISAGFPVALSIGPPQLSQLFPEEQALIQELKAAFEATMAKSPSQDLDSPEYFDHWKRALRASDHRLLLMLGGDRFNKVSALAAAQAATP